MPTNTTSSLAENTTTEGVAAPDRSTDVNQTLITQLTALMDQIQNPATAREAIRTVLRTSVMVGLTAGEANTLLTEPTFKS